MTQTKSNGKPRHVVAVIGGATAGAEVAGKLAERGVEVVVFEQNSRPYGKIEDGLPRWHVALRRKEYETINAKLANPYVHFVPNTTVGKDVEFADLARNWGFSAVVLACGAWRDRPLPVEGADAYLGRGLVYQNPFIIWFNHCHEKGYTGETFEPDDGVLVVGGGLASIDVVKVLMLETTRRKLTERGIEVEMLDLEVKGIPRTLEKHGLRFEELGLDGCTLFYRRRVEDMPLVEAPADASEERLAKVANSRRKLLEKAMEKYRFRFEPNAAPDGLIVEQGRLVGLRFRRTRIEGRKVIPLDETFERRGPYVISSIGSIPERIAGIEMEGELFRFTDWDLGRLDGYPTVFAAGNIVTGKGNIVASRKHAEFVQEHLAAQYLGLANGHDDEQAPGDDGSDAERAAAIADEVGHADRLSADAVAKILARVAEQQKRVGYSGDYESWIRAVTPADFV